MATSKPLLTQIREAKRMADAAFWQLLDLRILLNEIEADQITATQGDGKPGSRLLDEEENHEDYEPQGDNPSGDA